MYIHLVSIAYYTMFVFFLNNLKKNKTNMQMYTRPKVAFELGESTSKLTYKTLMLAIPTS